jgi:hypothetical protein
MRTGIGQDECSAHGMSSVLFCLLQQLPVPVLAPPLVPPEGTSQPLEATQPVLAIAQGGTLLPTPVPPPLTQDAFTVGPTGRIEAPPSSQPVTQPPPRPHGLA